MLIFGLDLGTTSIGSGVIRIDKSRNQGSILRLGVRIFPEARDPKGTPLNQQRRSKRMMRRQIRRRKERRRALNEAFADAGFLPRFGSPEWEKVMRLDPYPLRKKGLTEALAPMEFGRALYHLAKRRHFKGRELDEDDGQETAAESNDEKEARSNREETIRVLKTSGLTLGEWLAEKPHGERKRGVHATREIVAAEFDELWNAQLVHHERLRDPEFRAQVEHIALSQRPVFWRKATLGQCPLEPGAELCPRGSWLSQQRRMLEKLNNLALAGGNARPLDPSERAAILAKLQTQGSMSWTAARRALEPLFKARGESAKTVKFNLEIGGDKKLLGNPLEAKLADIFGGSWLRHPHKKELRAEIHRRLWTADYGEIGTQRVVIRSDSDRRTRRLALRESFVRDFSATDAQANALADLKFPQGWERYSTTALAKILPELERGIRFGTLIASPEQEWIDWRNANFPNRLQPTGEIRDRLPSPREKDEMRRLSELRNPTVVRVQNELRKVVNNLIGLYGKPDLIRVELTRKIGLSKKEREKFDDANRDRERKRNAAKRDLEANGIPEPSREDIEKWLLWDECGKFDPYSGRSICFDDLFKNNVFQVEHIWPRSISLDDSFANKTLCHRDWNQRKGNRTPHQAFGATDEWQAMKDRVWKRVFEKAMPRRKALRFCWEGDIPEDFTERQLNDTGWAARAVVKQLKTLWPDIGPTAPVTVQVVTGRVTAHLRRLWQLNNILADNGEKTRGDHRHHAVDALVVACAHPGVTQDLSRYWQNVDDPRGSIKSQIASPWPTIRPDAEKAVAEIIVSHRVRKKVSGPLHKETTYGDTGSEFKTKSGVYRQFVTRKRVEALTKSELAADPDKDGEGIRDGEVRNILRKWVAAHGGEPKKAFPPYPKLPGDRGKDVPEIRKVRILSKQQTKLMAEVSTGFADLGDNHHIAIYRSSDGSMDFEVVSLFEAARRLSKREPIVRRNKENSSFVMSLGAGDAVEIPEGDKKGIWIVQGAWANGQVVLERANDADHSTTFRPNPSTLISAGARKVAIDPIGRIHPARD